ncbi:UNVERIFIED_CONTAM: hypothetical protein K2H54_054974 [Gekko kuhli]
MVNSCNPCFLSIVHGQYQGGNRYCLDILSGAFGGPRKGKETRTPLCLKTAHQNSQAPAEYKVLTRKGCPLSLLGYLTRYVAKYAKSITLPDRGPPATEGIHDPLPVPCSLSEKPFADYGAR